MNYKLDHQTLKTARVRSPFAAATPREAKVSIREN